jgi:hypothetical protein
MSPSPWSSKIFPLAISWNSLPISCITAGCGSLYPAPNIHPLRGYPHPTPAFQIYHDLASRQPEEALRRAADDEIEERFWAGIRRMGEMAAMSPEH